MIDRRWGARVGFAGLGLALAAQFVVKSVASEPYPGLFGPSFGSVPLVDGRYFQTKPQVTIIFADASQKRVRPSELLPPSDTTPAAVFRSVFDTHLDPADPRTISWLQERIETILPGRDPETVVIEWFRLTYAASDRSLLDRHRVRNYRIEVGQ